MPNRTDIKRCPIWKVLGVTECNNCDTMDTMVQCWEEESVLPESLVNCPICGREFPEEELFEGILCYEV